MTTIKESLKTQPVLLYCETKLIEELKANDLSPIIIDDCRDFVMLVNLHNKSDYFYKLIVACQPKTMRGSDFRSKDVGITLIVAKSFNSNNDL